MTLKVPMNPLFRLILPALLTASVVSVSAQTLDRHHLLLDSRLDTATHSPFAFRDFKTAAAHFTDTTTLYITPGVYWIDDPDHPEIVVGKDGREPFGIIVKGKIIHFIGLGASPQDVVLASQRGQTQGAVGNFTMVDFWCDSLYVENLTMGNYCNVDLDYPLNPSLSRKKRSEAITQAHVGYVHGRYLWAKAVRFISRLNLNPLNGAGESYYEDCHFECTDDAMNGSAVYRHCDIDLYGQKPFWSTFGKGAMFIDCDFTVKSDNRDMYFCKQGGPLTLIDCRYHAPVDSIYIGWTAYPQQWLRCYQQNFTLNGKPYLIGNRQPDNTVLLQDYDSEDIPFMPISQHQATLLTGRDTLLLSSQSSQWSVQEDFEEYITLRLAGRDSVLVIPSNYTDEIAEFCVIASAADGRQAACQLTVLPSELPPPVFLQEPSVRFQDGRAIVDYQLDLQGRRDESRIEWFRSYNGCEYYSVGDSHDYPAREYQMHAADRGQCLVARVYPRHQRSGYGSPVEAAETVPASMNLSERTYTTDFHDFPCGWQPLILEGFWTVDGYKPADTAEYPWNFDRSKPMWTYGEGYNGAVGKGLLQEQRGARLMYTPIEKDYGDMSLTLEVDPTKTAGQGFGSATGQYMDVCLKFDTRTLTGYGLRIIRTSKYAKAVDFYLVRYQDGEVTAISEPISSTCYRTGCTISLRVRGSHLSAHVETTTPRPADSDLPHVVDLSADIVPNTFGGVAIQHTGSSGGESTTMLHRLCITW